MRRTSILVLSLVGFGLALALLSMTADAQPASRQSGIEKRVPWTTSKVIGSPEPPPPYKTERVFAKLKFEEPLDMTYLPGTNRLIVAERWGKIHSFVNDNAVAKSDLLLEIKPTMDSKGMPMKHPIYAVVPHPKFKDNGYIFVTWIPHPEKEGHPKGSRVSRFTVKGEPPVADLATEKVIIEWPNGGHNGGCLKFGPDGMLYLVTGDGSGIADELVIGQDLSSIFAKMLRIDVDRPDPGKGYSVPKDNPFVNMKGARPEVYAYGLRQLWRFSFDRKTGDCWGGEVGQDLWEMVYKIKKGGNYGWSVMEGTHPFRPERKKGPTPIVKPIVEHSHSDFRSITGGFVYHGKRLPELDGAFIYGDFDTGRIWMLEHKAGKESSRKKVGQNTEIFEGEWEILANGELARTTYRIITWAEDADGELYFMDFTGGGIYQLAKAPPVQPAYFPRKLSETGIFDSVKDHVVAPGVIPYSVNAQLWGDHAVKDRFLAIPGNGQIGFDEITYPQPSPGSTPGWKFPDGTVLVKTFSMDMERGNPKSRKRLETRLLHFQQFPGTQEYGDQYWRGYTYKWNDAQTDAELVDEKGLDLPLKIKTKDGVVEQNYRIPSRAECTLCHTNAHKFALGVATMQMNRDHAYNGVIANQIDTLNHIGLFSNKVEPASKLPKLADYDDKSHSIEARARSYLHSNCAHCHIKWGGGNAEFKLLATLPLAEMGIVNVAPAHGNFKIDGAKILVPGHPEKSILLHRMKMTGLGRMPHIGSRVVHDAAVEVVAKWIEEMRKE